MGVTEDQIKILFDFAYFLDNQHKIVKAKEMVRDFVSQRETIEKKNIAKTKRCSNG